MFYKYSLCKSATLMRTPFLLIKLVNFAYCVMYVVEMFQLWSLLNRQWVKGSKNSR